MSRRAAGFLLLVVFFVVVPMQCRRAGGAAHDPLDDEAQNAFVSYLRIDTSNPPGNETAGATFLRDFLARGGVSAQLVGDDPKRQGVYARLSSGTNEKALLLLSHIDVVPADASAWTVPPFSAEQSGGYIWGRGALDLKSLTIAEAMAVIELKRSGAKLRRDVVFLAVPDEELGGVHGTARLLERNPELFRNVGYVVNEGGMNETAVDDVLFWGIEVQQKLPLWLRVTSTGSGGHAATPPDGGGAPSKLIRALGRIQAVPTPYRLAPSVASAAAAAAKVRRDARSQRLALFREPLDTARIDRELPPGYRSLLRDTITITHLYAGSAINVVPARAGAEIDIRLLPDEGSESMVQKIREAAGDDASVEVVLSSEPTVESPSTGELFDALASAFHAAAPRSAVAPVVGAGTTDSRYFRARGIVAYGIAPFKVNYYDADSVHGNDERIRAKFFLEGCRVVRNAVRKFCAEK